MSDTPRKRSGIRPGSNGGGRPKGSKNKMPPAEIKLRVIQNMRREYEGIMCAAARSKLKTDRRWFAEEYRKLLPKDEALTVTGDKIFELVLPTPEPPGASGDGT